VRLMRAFFFAACLFCSPCICQQSTALRTVGELPDEALEVEFISAAVGWCRTTGGLYRTGNGGTTWALVQPPPRDGYDHLWQFQFINSLTGWVRTVLDPLYWTADGGLTWTEGRLPIMSSRGSGPRGLVEDVRFTSSKTGWVLALREVPGDPSKESIRYRIAGEHTVYIPALFRTDNGGRTWTQQRYPDLKGVPDRLDFADVDHGISIELNQTLFTSDGGENWHKSRYCSSVNIKNLREASLGSGTFEATAAQLLDAHYGWWSVEGDTFRTADGGATWCPSPPIRWQGRVLRLHDIRFANRNLGWAIPTISEQWPQLTPCFQTHDGGETWASIVAPPGTRIEGISVPKDGPVYFWGYKHLFALSR